MMYFTIWSLNRGCVGTPYKNKIEAIEDGAYQVWNEKRIKAAHKFGNGTFEDLEEHAKWNKEHLLTEEQFYRLLSKLPESSQRKHQQWIEDELKWIESH